MDLSSFTQPHFTLLYEPQTPIGKKFKQLLLKSDAQVDYDFAKQLTYKPHPTLMPQCNKTFIGSTELYNCFDCQQSKAACICSECFKNGNHENHRVVINDRQFAEYGATCDCGNKDMWKPEGFCKNHCGKITDLPQIEEQQMREYILVFQDLFALYFQLAVKTEVVKYKKFFQSLIKYLINLNNQSLYYNIMTIQMLLSEEKLEKEETILKGLINKRTNQLQDLHFVLFMKLFTLPTRAYDVIKQFVLTYNNKAHLQLKETFQSIFFQYIGHTDMIVELAEKQRVLILPNINTQQGRKRFQSMLFYFLTLQDKSIPLTILKCMIQKKVFQDKFYMASLSRFFLSILDVLRDDKNSLEKIIEQIFRIDRPSIFFRDVQNSVIVYFQQKPEDADIKTLFTKLNLSQDKLINFYRDIILGILLSFENFEAQSMILLIFLEKLGLKNLLQEQIKEFLQKTVQTEENKIVLPLVIYKALIFGALNCESALIKIVNINKIHIDGLQEVSKKILTRIFDVVKVMNKQLFFEVLNTYAGNYKDQLNTFIKQNLNYDDSTQQYNYIGPPLGFNPLQANNIKYFHSLEQTPSQVILFDIILSEQIIIDFVDKFQELKKIKWQTDEHRDSLIQNLIQFLILLNCITEGQNQKLSDFLEDLRNQDHAGLFDLIKNNPTLSMNLKDKLQIHSNNLMKKISSNFKEKADLIKKKKFEQLRAKQKKIKLIQEDEDENITNQEICTYCHEKETQQNEFYHFAYIQQTTALSTALGSEEIQYDLFFCKHHIHKQCFISQYGDVTYLLCPLCKNLNNCILPSKLALMEDLEREIYINRIETIISLTFQKQQLSVFEIFFNYLIYSRSLKVLMLQDQVDLKFRKQTDSMVASLLMNMYFKGNAQKKLTYQKMLHHTKQKIKNDKSKQDVKFLLKDFMCDVAIEEICKGSIQYDNYTDRVQLLLKKFDKSEINKILDQFEGFAKVKFQLKKYRIRLKELISFPQFPLHAEEYSTTYFKCDQCKSLKSTIWVCFLCKVTYCNGCKDVSKHLQEIHLGSGAVFQRQSAGYVLIYMKNLYSNRSLYINDYKEQWNILIQPKGFTANMQEIENFLNDLLVCKVPKLITKETLVSKLNSMVAQ